MSTHLVQFEDSSVGVNIDAESLYKSYNDGKPYEEVFDEAYRMIADGFENQPEFNVEDFFMALRWRENSESGNLHVKLRRENRNNHRDVKICE